MADYKRIIPFILKAEGGLSRATTDSASKHPSPCSFNGLTGWHTNKGVTYQAFVSLAPSLGYEASCTNFITMPQNIWEKIFKIGYWDAVKGDAIKSQAVADQLADMAWGAGAGAAALLMQKTLNRFYNKKLIEDGGIGQKTIDAINSIDAKDLFTKFTMQKITWYNSLPGQQANYAGWTNRINALTSELTDFIKNNPGKSGAGALALLALLYAASQN